MIKIIELPVIGQIRIHEIIDEYDFPILFVGVDIFDSFILFQVVSNVDNKKITIANKITKDAYKKLKTNETSIQSIYREPEQDVFYLICEENKAINVTSTSISDLDKFGITKGNCYFGTLSKDILVEKSALENAILTNRPTMYD